MVTHLASIPNTLGLSPSTNKLVEKRPEAGNLANSEIQTEERSVRLLYKKQYKGSYQVWLYSHSEGRNITSENLLGLHNEFKTSLENFWETDLKSRSTDNWDLVQWTSTCSAHTKPWVQSPVLKKRERKGENGENEREVVARTLIS